LSPSRLSIRFRRAVVLYSICAPKLNRSTIRKLQKSCYHIREGVLEDAVARAFQVDFLPVVLESAISPGVIGRCGDMVGVWIDPVTAQVMMTWSLLAIVLSRNFGIVGGFNSSILTNSPWLDLGRKTLMLDNNVNLDDMSGIIGERGGSNGRRTSV
jgi:hypothetical protein